MPCLTRLGFIERPLDASEWPVLESLGDDFWAEGAGPAGPSGAGHGQDCPSPWRLPWATPATVECWGPVF